MTFHRTRCATKATPTHEELLRQIYYDRVSGLFLWRHAAKGRKPWAQAGSTRDDGYLLVFINGRFQYGHRLAWFYVTGEWPVGLVDHKDGNPSNNAFSNLRLATKQTNAENLKGATKSNRSGFLGVHRRSDSGRFTAQITINGKCRSLGTFATAELAYAAYLVAKREGHKGCTL